MARSIRDNVSPALVLAIIALFCSIGGVALAGKKAPKNSVVKKSIKANAVTAEKIADGQVGSAEIGDGQVGASELANGAVTASKLAPGAVTQVSDRSVGRSAAQADQCPSPGVALPSGPPLPECVGFDMTLARDARVLLIGDGVLGAFGDTGLPPAQSGACQITIDGSGPVSGAAVSFWADADANSFQEEGISVSQVTGVLPAGSHHFGVICSGSGPVIGTDFHLSAVSLSAD